jgi:hypothetical protein
MSKDIRENTQEIPTEENQQQTRRFMEEQNKVPGEQRDETVKNIPEAAAMGQLLKDLNFPADKQKIVQFATNHSNSSSDSEQAISALKKLQDRTYNNVYEVTEAAGLVR